MSIYDIQLDEVADLIAEAARVSRHAKLAYERMLQAVPTLRPLEARQRLIAGRMDEAA